MLEENNTSYRQMFFDMNGAIHQETYVYHRELSEEEKELYNSLLADANQMTIFDYIKE